MTDSTITTTYGGALIAFPAQFSGKSDTGTSIKPAGNRGQGRPTNEAAGRTRRYLTEPEVERLMKAARSFGRHGHRDATIILMLYRHGMRVSELVRLRWSQITFGRSPEIHIRRSKNGKSGTHPLFGPENKALQRLQRENPNSPYVFTTERGGPLDASTVRKMIKRAGELAKLKVPASPHMLRHGCGYKLANEGKDTRSIQAYIGHRSIQSTTEYTDTAPNRFNDFWKD